MLGATETSMVSIQAPLEQRQGWDGDVKWCVSATLAKSWGQTAWFFFFFFRSSKQTSSGVLPICSWSGAGNPDPWEHLAARQSDVGLWVVGWVGVCGWWLANCIHLGR
jgi:hypothetical protein